MRILLVDVDSLIPNVALQKLKFYYESKHDTVCIIKDKSPTILPFTQDYDKIYVSCIFDYHKHFCKKWEGIAEIGGTGYSITKKLPQEIEEVKPRKNIGFTTRGCIRNCSWCIVQQKEGKIRVVSDIYDIWDGKTKIITLLDNNILALPDHFLKLCKQINEEKLKVDFNSGFDHRLLTEKLCLTIFSLQHKSNWRGTTKEIAVKPRFAFDHISHENSVKKALKIIKKCAKIKHKDAKYRTRWYVYVGVNDTVENVLHRIKIIRDAGQLVFLMRDRDKRVQNNKELAKIYSWTCHVPLYTTEAYPPNTTEAYPPKELPKIINDKQTLFQEI